MIFLFLYDDLALIFHSQVQNKVPEAADAREVEDEIGLASATGGEQVGPAPGGHRARSQGQRSHENAVLRCVQQHGWYVFHRDSQQT